MPARPAASPRAVLIEVDHLSREHGLRDFRAITVDGYPLELVVDEGDVSS